MIDDLASFRLGHDDGDRVRFQDARQQLFALLRPDLRLAPVGDIAARHDETARTRGMIGKLEEAVALLPQLGPLGPQPPVLPREVLPVRAADMLLRNHAALCATQDQIVPADTRLDDVRCRAKQLLVPAIEGHQSLVGVVYADAFFKCIESLCQKLGWNL
jgi:hypothetical protein